MLNLSNAAGIKAFPESMDHWINCGQWNEETCGLEIQTIHNDSGVSICEKCVWG